MKRFRLWVISLLMAALAFSLSGSGVNSVANAQEMTGERGNMGRTGNTIFIHPDGTGLNHWNAGRMYWHGPDGMLEWDRMPEMAVYRGHMSDRLTGTSNGGATVHAFGYKVLGPGSYGKDGGGDETGREILALSGYPGSIMREAANAGYPVGVVNDGDAAEPGTGVFLAEVDDRGESNEIVRQFLDGRPGFEGEPGPVVMLGGGERFFLPEGTPLCEGEITPDCYLHSDPVNQRGPAREDGRNLILEAIDAGYEVIRTRDEFEALMTELEADESYAPMVLGLFAADDIFNDEPEEVIIDLGLIDESKDADSQEGNLILWGGMPETASYDPPTPAEMMEMALMILERHSQEMEQPFFLVAEVESTDNLPNNANSIGFLRAVQHADDLIGVARAFQAGTPDTLIITAADSDGGGPQVFSPPPVDEAGNVTVSGGNPTGSEDDEGFPLDGVRGQTTAPFVAAPDSFGTQMEFAIGYPGRNDVAGAILSRAQGMNAGLLGELFYGQFDSTDVYRMMYLNLFGQLLPAADGMAAPDRSGDAVETDSAQDGEIDGDAEEQSLVDVASAAGQFETLLNAAAAAGLAEALGGLGPFTVFAPTDDAFAALDEETLQAALNDPEGLLTDVLLYHVVDGAVMSTDLSDGQELETLGGAVLTVSIDGDTVMVNDATVTSADMEAGNGVIHVIDTVLLP